MSLITVMPNGDNVLHVAVRAKRKDSTRALMEFAKQGNELEFFFNHKNKDGKTALELAYEIDATEIAEIISSYIVDYAVEEKDSNFAEMLLQGNDDGNTPLHCAVFFNGDLEIFEKFVAMGWFLGIWEKMIQAKNKHHLTPYELAVLLDKKQFVQGFSVANTLVQMQASVPSIDAIKFYFTKQTTIEGNNILQQHVSADSLESVLKIKQVAQTIDGLWTQMLEHQNHAKKTAKTMTTNTEISSVLH